jgi:hypothetical protein
MDSAAHRTTFRVTKYANQQAKEENRPDAVEEYEGNLLLNEGINNLWELAAGEAVDDWSAPYLGVGDSATAASATQTGLQAATNLLYLAMDVGYPETGADQKIVFSATFDEDDANFEWNEWSISTSDSNAGVNLNRKAQAMGTKANPAVWTLEVDVTLT